mmetsp:Transcript_58166/g.129660  ORF Transcript_58166/g.129660 Transcript_58166/m.129660 type:complete len:85 (+) Transcript_58166:936-1190(+)
MRAMGVTEKLKALGAANGDLIMVGDVDFSYFDESPMAARARLAGFGDEDNGDEDEFGDASRREDERLDELLGGMLDQEGEVMRF